MHYFCKIKVFGFIEKIIAKLGKSFFEIYLLNIAVFEFIQLKGTYEMNVQKWIGVSIAAILAGVLYNAIIQGIRKWGRKLVEKFALKNSLRNI